jgi:amidophosphoribosyltransferase
MCGIVGLFIKNPALEHGLGRHLAAMLLEMTERGPDSAGVAVYRNPLSHGTKVTVLSTEADYPWRALGGELERDFPDRAGLQVLANSAVLAIDDDTDVVLAWLRNRHPELRISSSGTTIEIYKEKGSPDGFVDQFRLVEFQGSHALGHTRMATESAVTTEHSHPFSTGHDLCLVHNGSLSNHNRLRLRLRRQGIEFQTDNDSEVAAGYLAWRIREGDSLNQALEAALTDLDGFYTFAIGTRDGFAVLRDPIGCKPAVMAETDDWVAMASEFRAIAQLPGVNDARIWEPEPARIYSWERSAA